MEWCSVCGGWQWYLGGQCVACYFRRERQMDLFDD